MLPSVIPSNEVFRHYLHYTSPWIHHTSAKAEAESRAELSCTWFLNRVLDGSWIAAIFCSKLKRQGTQKEKEFHNLYSHFLPFCHPPYLYSSWDKISVASPWKDFILSLGFIWRESGLLFFCLISLDSSWFCFLIVGKVCCFIGSCSFPTLSCE